MISLFPTFTARKHSSKLQKKKRGNFWEYYPNVYVINSFGSCEWDPADQPLLIPPGTLTPPRP